MRRFRTQYLETEEHCFQPEENNLPSLTEPNMALTPKQILERFATGRPVDVSSNLEYTGEEYFPDIRTMDLTEISDLMEENALHISQLEDEIKQAQKRKKELESKKTVETESKKTVETVTTVQDDDPA